MSAILLQLLIAVLPAAVTGLTAYYLIRQLLERQHRREQYTLARSRQETTLPLRMQAYERLSLLCERIAINNLLLRQPASPEMTARQYRVGLLLTIQQEFEHNVTQQVYVSNQLWSIIKTARDDAAEMVALAAEQGGTAPEVARRLLRMAAERETDPMATAQQAIRREAGTLFA